MMHNDESTASSAVSIQKNESMLTFKTTRPTTLSAAIIESKVPNKKPLAKVVPWSGSKYGIYYG